MNKTLKRVFLSPLNILYKLSPKITLKLLFQIKQGSKLNLHTPKTFNEKINWLKLFYRNELMPICADKYSVRKYVEDCDCSELLTKLYWQGFNAKDIPFDELPNQFVVKVTHGSGMNIICKSKSELNIDEAINKLNKWLNIKYIPCYGEWFYGIVKPRIIIEEYIGEENGSGVPEDYKMFYFNDFNGKPGISFTAIDIGRFSNHTRNVYDNNWNQMTDVYLNWPINSQKSYEKPGQYERMVNLAMKLAKPFPHARIDFYVINEKIYFGEITFTDNAGFGKIKPNVFHEKMGSWIKLPPENVKEIG